MALFESEFRTVVMANAALIESFRPGILELNDSLPSITYQTITTERDINQAGKTALTFKTIQLNVWGATYSDTRTAAEQVREYLHGLVVSLPTFTVQSVIITSEQDVGFTEFPDSSKKYNIILEADIFYS